MQRGHLVSGTQMHLKHERAMQNSRHFSSRNHRCPCTTARISMNVSGNQRVETFELNVAAAEISTETRIMLAVAGKRIAEGENLANSA
jgi:hypothetical protein